MMGVQLILAAMLNNATRSEETSCLDYIIERYYEKETLLMYTTPGTEPPLVELTALKNKTVIHFHEKIPQLGRLIQNQTSDIVFYNFREPSELSDMFTDAKGSISGKIVVTIREATEDSVREIIEILWNITRATDVIVLASSATHVKAYTWFPYRPRECIKVRTLTVMDVWRNGSFTHGNDLFPVKVTRNLNGCKVYVSTRPMEPYVFPPEVPGRYEIGYEVKVLHEFARIFNFTLKFILPPDLINFWNVGNASTIHLSAFGMLLEHKIDLAFGAMMMREERYRIAEALYPHTIETLIFTYPKPGLKGNFYSTYTVFSPSLWLAIASFHVFAALAIFFAYNAAAETSRKSFSSCFFNCIAILCNNINFRLPKTTLLRILVINYVIYAYHLSAAYQSYLFLLLTHSEWLKPPKNMAQLVAQGYKAYLFYSGQGLYNQSEHEVWNKILQPGKHAFFDGSNVSMVLNQIATKKSAFILFSHNNIRYFSTVMYPDGGKSIFSHMHFFTCPITMFMSPGNPLRDLFSIQLHKLINTGIFRQWKLIINARQAAAAKKKFNVTTYIKSKDAQPLTLKHVEGAFFFWFLLLLFSLIVFLAEVLLNKAKNFPKKPTRK